MSNKSEDGDSELDVSSRVLLDAIPHVTLVLDTDRRILHANRAAVSSFGMSLSELRTKHCGELLPFDIPCEEEPSADQQVICSPMVDGEGVVSHYLLMMTDAPSADSIHEEDSLHRLLFENSPDEILYIDRWGKVVDVNSRIYDLFGIRPENAIGKRVTYFAKYAKISVDTLLELFGKVILGTYSTEPIEMECIHEDGHSFFVEFKATRVLREGKLAGLQVLVRDVTERRQNAAKVRESEQLFQQMLDAVSDRVTVIDRDHNIIYSNWNGFAEVPEHRRVLPARCFHAYRNLETPCPDCKAFDVFDDGRPVHVETKVSEGPWLDLQALPLRDVEGNVKYVVEWVRDVTQVKQYEEAIRQSESRFRALVETTSDLIWEVDDEQRYVYVSPQVEAILGYDAKEILGNTPYDFMVEEDREVVREVMKRLRGSEEPIVGLQNRARTKDGRIVVLETNGVPIFDEQGKFAGYRGVDRDITQLLRSDAALQESKELYRITVDSLSEAIHIVDADLRIILVNTYMREWMQRIGIMQDLIGRRITDVIPFLAEEVLDQYRRVLATGETIASEEVTEVGERAVMMETTKVPIRQGEAIRGVLTTISDVSDRRARERELRASEERLALALAATNDGLWDWNVQTGEAYFSPRYYTMLGYEPSEMPGGFETWRSLLHPEDLPVAEQVVAAHVDGNKPGFLVEFRMKTKDGGWRWVLGRGKVVERDEQGRPIRMVGTHTDITDRKLAEREKVSLQDQLIQAQKMESIGRLAGGVAHDFNNLLTSISGNVELALMDISQNDPLRDSLEEIGKAGRSAANLTRQLLAFSRKQMIEPKVLNINEVVEGSHRMLKRLIGEDVDVVFLASPDLGGVRMDPGQLEQMVVNLVVNARDAMPDGGKLTLETGNVRIDEKNWSGKDVLEVGEYVMLAVSDNGVGMDEEVLQHLYEPFFTTKDKGKGTGLGLATVYGAVKQNGGTVRVYSELGQGTTFKMYFPRVQAEPYHVRLPNDDTLPEGKEAIIVVEDEDMVRALAVRVLKRQGYDVMAFANGGEAVMALETSTKPIHLLLTDVIMPGINGKILADKVRILRPGIRVLFTSGYTEDAIAHHGVLDEGIRFISKPYAPQTLARKVREVLDEEDRD